ncbi:MAG: hypothetical protein HYS13_09230 [Planctomycetia bacterium]|nr:hypothetical protein [Planctomycetia bacterium]
MDGPKQLKVGVWAGDGPPPGYRWNVGILDLAFDEVRRFLTEDQYDHIAAQFKELARENDPSHSETASIDKIEDFYELRDKGGVLGKINVRVFFGLDKGSIIVLGGIKKESEGQTPAGTKITMRRRWRKYKNGDYGRLEQT